MKKAGILLTAVAIFSTLITGALAATDGVYTLSEGTYTWDGTDADRFKAASPPDYDYDYGDETSLSYSLPWPFIYYGQTYNQIRVDTNGNIWFGYTGSAYSITLPNTGKGPVIAALNNDLTSLYYGGFFIQHKNDAQGDRVVIEWQAETYGDEGTASLNNFEVVLFSNGTIRADYKTSNAVNSKDFGSGISKDDNTHYLSLTSNFAPTYSLSGRSFAFLPKPPIVNVVFSGTGSGTVTSTPDGVACNTNCSSSLPLGTSLMLHPAASQYSLFTGWTNGTCSGTEDCLFTLNADISVTAVFDYDVSHQVQVSGDSNTFYSSIQAAYDVAADPSTIKLWATNYSESLSCGRPVTITLEGGYDSGYSFIVGETVINGALTISNGKIIGNGLRLR